MTQGPSALTPEVQAAISSLYQQGFEAGRTKGYEEGINAVRTYLDELSTTPRPGTIKETGASLDTAIEELDFSVRTYNCLKREGMHTVGDVLARSDMQLSEIRNFGRKCMDEVKQKLADNGYTLREEPDRQ